MSIPPDIRMPDGAPRALPYGRLASALRTHGQAVLAAPPGTGKSTGVPLALLADGFAVGGRILMLQPRRVAARAVAARMAALLNEPPGATVGYRTRLDARVGKGTRIEVVTDGILTARLQHDPELADVAVLILDEFHERSVQADLGLALAMDVRASLRPDLRLLLMSATLDTGPVAELLGGAPVIEAPGRPYPVQTVHLGERAPTPLAQRVASAVAQALETHPGDVLVFLPGVGEIRAARRALESRAIADGVRVMELSGALSAAEQDRAVAAAPAGIRKVVLATNVAETSLTIEGVRVVVDSGLVRRPLFSPASGMTRLETVRVSGASAEQRRGRAGRTAPGVCLRLWSEAVQRRLQPATPPRILDADLAPLALELACWGDPDGRSLRWMDPPPSASLARAAALLQALGATAADGRVTAHGRALAAAGTHPRLAHMLLQARAADSLDTACAIAALLEERDPLPVAERDADLRTRLSGLRNPEGATAAGQRLLRSARLLARRCGGRFDARRIDPDRAGPLLAHAYPDRIGRSRDAGSGRYRLSSGRGAALERPDALARHEFIVVASLDGAGPEARIRLAAPLRLDDIEAAHGAQLQTVQRVEWDDRTEAVTARRERLLDRLPLLEEATPDPDPDAVLGAMLKGIRALGLEALPWSPPLRALQHRVRFVRTSDPEPPLPWPDLSDESLLEQMEHWLAPWLGGCSRRAHLARVDLRAALMARLPYPLAQRLEQLAPTHLQVPSGSRVALDYCGGDAPVLAVRLQEVFGLPETPRVCAGRVPVTLHLLSPARRPVQVTQDLASFWTSTYHEVRRELKGRYPRHYWPENPHEATATRHVRPRSG